jgi:hypothetical protein
MGVPARLVMDAAHTAAMKSQQGAVDLFGNNWPPTPTAVFGNGDPCSAGRGRPGRGGQHLDELGAQLLGVHCRIAFMARR